MRIEEIAIHAASTAKLFCVNRAQRFLQQRVCAIAITQACPKVDLPCETPTRSDIATQLESFPRGSEEIRSLAMRDLAARKEAVQMRHVPVLSLGRFHVP